MTALSGTVPASKLTPSIYGSTIRTGSASLLKTSSAKTVSAGRRQKLEPQNSSAAAVTCRNRELCGFGSACGHQPQRRNRNHGAGGAAVLAASSRGGDTGGR